MALGWTNDILQQLNLEFKVVFLNVPHVSHLTMDSLFALIGKVCQFGVLKAETDFYLLNTPLSPEE